MPVCIAGMHRSGTSFIARLLQHGGLDLGDSGDLLPPGPDNPDGYFEHRRFYDVNERLLRYFGGDWDRPPTLPNGWVGAPELLTLRRRGEHVAAQFAGREPWGWKDPRNCLTLPFWQAVLPRLEIVICIRNPLEVAISLNRRNAMSYELGLHLWKTYTERLLAAAQGRAYLVVHYEACLAQTDAELARLGDFIGIDMPEVLLAEAKSLATARMRHSSFSLRHLVDSRVPEPIVEMYRRLCDESGWTGEHASDVQSTAHDEPDHDQAARALAGDAHEMTGERLDRGPHGAGMTTMISDDRSLRRSIIELELLRRDLRQIQASDAHHRALAEQLQRELAERDTIIASLTEDRAKQEPERIAERDRLLGERDQQTLQIQATLQAEIENRDKQIREMHDAMQTELANRDDQIVRLRTTMQAELDSRDAQILETQATLQAEIEARDQQIGLLQAAMQAEIDARDHQIVDTQSRLLAVIEERGGRLLTLQAEHEEWREWIVRLESDIERRDALIALLRQEMDRRDELLAALRNDARG